MIVILEISGTHVVREVIVCTIVVTLVIAKEGLIGTEREIADLLLIGQ